MIKHLLVNKKSGNVVREIECDKTFTRDRAKDYAEKVRRIYAANQNIPIAELEIK